MRKGVALCALFVLLTGCAPHAREPEGLALVGVLGVDMGDGVVLSAVCTAQAGEDALCGSVTAPDLSAALAALPHAGRREMALTNVSYLIINEGADLWAVLLTVLEDRELNPSAQVWLAEDAAALLAGCDDPEGYLRVLSRGEDGAPMAWEVLAALASGEDVTLPRLTGEGRALRLDTE